MGQFPLAQAQSHLPNPYFIYLDSLFEYMGLLRDYRTRECPRAKNPADQQRLEKIHRVLLVVTQGLIQNLRRHVILVPELMHHQRLQRACVDYRDSEMARSFLSKHAVLIAQYDILKQIWDTAFNEIERLKTSF